MNFTYANQFLVLSSFNVLVYILIQVPAATTLALRTNTAPMHHHGLHFMTCVRLLYCAGGNLSPQKREIKGVYIKKNLHLFILGIIFKHTTVLFEKLGA
jgi:hypothetical protein